MRTKVNLDFLKIQHIGIPVRSLDHTIPFYQLLGFEEVMRKPFDHEEGNGTCVMMCKRDIIMEFYQLPQTAINREISTRSDGHIDHIAFDVNNIDLAFNTLKNAGFIPIQESPVFLNFWDNGVKFFHIIGPDGERLEFNEIL